MSAASEPLNVQSPESTLRKLKALTGKKNKSDAVLFAIRYTVKTFEKAKREAGRVGNSNDRTAEHFAHSVDGWTA